MRDERGIVVDYVTGALPDFGNDDDRADAIAVDLVETLHGQGPQRPMYRDAMPTQSVLTITLERRVRQGDGSTPDGAEPESRSRRAPTR